MKNLAIKLIRKILFKLDKMFDMPKYRLKHENIMVHITENYVHISYKNDEHLANIKLTKESYFAIRDKVKSFEKKNVHSHNQIGEV